MALPKTSSTVFDLKSGTLPVLVLVLRTAELPALAEALHQRMGPADEPQGDAQAEPVVLDLGALASVGEAGAAIDFHGLAALLRRHRLQPVAVRGAGAQQAADAAQAGLTAGGEGAFLAASPTMRGGTEVAANAVREESDDFPATVPVDPATAAQPAAPAPEAPVAAASLARPTLVIDRPLRSGQQVYARGADLVVTAVVNFGAEVIADGHIHVYAPLRGRAIAGARGSTDARIFTTCLEPELIAIAGTYRTSETALPADVRGKPAQVRLVGDRLVMEPV